MNPSIHYGALFLVLVRTTHACAAEKFIFHIEGVLFKDPRHPNHTFVKNELTIIQLKPNKDERSEKIIDHPIHKPKHLLRGDKPIT